MARGASDQGIGVVLSRIRDGGEKVIAYASRTLSKSERNYSVTKREMLALVYYSQHFRHSYGRRTFHNALRCLRKLAEFDFNVPSRPGKRHGNADGLSRRPQGDSGIPEVSAVETVASDAEAIWYPTWRAAGLRSLQLTDHAIQHVLCWRESGRSTRVARIG